MDRKHIAIIVGVTVLLIIAVGLGLGLGLKKAEPPAEEEEVIDELADETNDLQGSTAEVILPAPRGFKAKKGWEMAAFDVNNDESKLHKKLDQILDLVDSDKELVNKLNELNGSNALYGSSRRNRKHKAKDIAFSTAAHLNHNNGLVMSKLLKIESGLRDIESGLSGALNR